MLLSAPIWTACGICFVTAIIGCLPMAGEPESLPIRVLRIMTGTVAAFGIASLFAYAYLALQLS
jgi:hypothetical protein